MRFCNLKLNEVDEVQIFLRMGISESSIDGWVEGSKPPLPCHSWQVVVAYGGHVLHSLPLSIFPVALIFHFFWSKKFAVFFFRCERNVSCVQCCDE